jgi:hypothetical protein
MYLRILATIAAVLHQLIVPSYAAPQIDKRQGTTVSSILTPTVASSPSLINPFQSALSKFLNIKPTATPSSVQRLSKLQQLRKL